MTMKTTYKRQYSLMLDYEIYDWLREEAERSRRSQGEVIRSGMRRERKAAQMRDARAEKSAA
jgi:hypothetical protein